MNSTSLTFERNRERAALLRRLAEANRAAAAAAEQLAQLEEHVSERTYFSQLDGERPDGYVGDGTREGNRRAAARLLRVFRAHEVELGVIARGKARLVPVERWNAFVRANGSPRPRLQLVGNEPANSADALRAALGLVEGGGR